MRTQIIEAIKPEYLETFHNVDMDIINESIPEILAFLQETYSRITEEKLIEKEDTQRQYAYAPHVP